MKLPDIAKYFNDTLARRFLPLAAVLVFSFGAAYVAGQQTLRLMANFAPAAAASEAAEAIRSGVVAQVAANGHTVQLPAGRETFVEIFDERGNLLAGNAKLDGRQPVPPSGVFGRAREKGESRVTWQPRRDTRLAAVIIPIGEGKGFALAASSLMEPERLISHLSRLLLLGWILANLAVLAAFIFTDWWREKVVSRR